MKKENGVTMVSLVIYVIVMTLVVSIMSNIITSFYNNTETLKENIQEIINFNKFNSYFLKEVKAYDNEVDHVSANGDYILFKSGNSFSISEGNVYYNNIKICGNVENLSFSLIQGEEDEKNKYSIIKVTLTFEKYSKTLNYKLENIY